MWEEIIMSNNQFTYHEVDFLLPAQRFKINFSYISEQGLPFYREYILRLIHLASMSKYQIATYMGLSKREIDEAVSDLAERGELTLSVDGRLILTEKSKAYFSNFDDSPKLASVQESQVTLSFDLITFSCHGKSHDNEWSAGLRLRADDINVSTSEAMVEKHFQRRFNEIYKKGYLPNILRSNVGESPSLYIVDSVTKLRQLAIRLNTEFKLDEEGNAIERQDFQQIDCSEVIHERMTKELNRLSKNANIISIIRAMMDFGDEETQKLFNASGSINMQFFSKLNNLQEFEGKKRCTFIGPIYSKDNSDKLQRYLTPILKNKIDINEDLCDFIWVAPSDPYWGKSFRFIASLSNFLERSLVPEKKDRAAKKLYKPILYVPVANKDDWDIKNQWKRELGDYAKHTCALREGFMDGNVEIIYFKDSMVVVVYHISYPESLPVTLPVGFISTDEKTVSKIGRILINYIEGYSSFDKPNNCGTIINQEG